MTTSVLAVAKRMEERSDQPLTHLAFQKLAYIAHMIHLGRHDGKPLVSGNFEAWDLGPVHPQLYRTLRRFGSRPVRPEVFRFVSSMKDNDASSLVDDVVTNLSDSTPRLVAITHWEGGAWAKHYIPDEKGILIPNEDILQEYKDRMNDTVAA